MSRPIQFSGPAVSVSSLRKRYGSTDAICDVSFEAGAGRIFGLLGPNGAGKTTTIECILGLRRPDSGSIRIDGLDVRTNSKKAKLMVGAQLQAAALQDKITPRQALDLFGSFYWDSFASDDLLERFDLVEKADRPFATLSGGQRQRLFLALALVNRPKVLVFDEPTAGLDPRARRDLRALIREIKADGHTVLLSTHDLEEAGELCDEVAILDRGRIIAAGPPGILIEKARTPARVNVRIQPPFASAIIDSLAGLARAIHCDGKWILETTSPTLLMADLLRRADETGAELLEMELRRPSLEDVFLELTGHPWPGEAEAGGAA